MSDLFNQPCADVLVIGVGALGCAVAGRGALNDASEFPRQADWAAIHTQSSELFSTGLDQRLHVVLPGGPISEAAIALILDARAEEWKRWCVGKRFVLIAASEDDAFAAAAACALAGMLRDSGTALLLAYASGEEQNGASSDLPLIRVALEETGANVSPRAIEALRHAHILEIVEACLGALRADSAASPWLSEVFSDFLRWGRLSACAGSADSVNAVLRELHALPGDDAESVFLIVQGADERSTTELNALRAGVTSAYESARAISVLSVEGRSPGDGLFWLRLARRAPSGNVVRLDQARQTFTSAAFAKM